MKKRLVFLFVLVLAAGWTLATSLTTTEIGLAIAPKPAGEAKPAGEGEITAISLAEADNLTIEGVEGANDEGTAEEEAAEYIKTMQKPVVAYLPGDEMRRAAMAERDRYKPLADAMGLGRWEGQPSNRASTPERAG